MSTLSDPPVERFQLSQLINDTRYRSYTFQFIALILLVLFFAYLGSNLVNNLREAGLNISFGFLSEPAGYDINQRLLDYNSQDSHLRASFLGLINTLIIAVLGCFTATIIGVTVGVLRLSNNWLVAKIMAIYVEIFRNVPVLIWILIIMAIFTASLPHMRSFHGDDPENTFALFNTLAVTKQGVWFSEPMFSRSLGEISLFGSHSLRFDVSLDFVAIIAVLMASFFGARAWTKHANKVQQETGVRPNTSLVNLAIWFVPLIALLIILGFYLDGPTLTGRKLKPIDDGIYLRNSLIALWFALSIYTAAFIAENVRAGILAISKGQTEAAASLGLRPGRIMNLVILPQALRVIIPPLISQYLNLTKNSSLAIAVGYMDITGTLGGITLNQTGRAIECVLMLMLFYLTISLSISAIMNAYNNAVKLKER
ncbi:putative glutamine ABC transporter permease protein GlnM [Roseovarius albus]|uniref:Putative glutamine ABC transporter permease protein GlnM n=1 Tax=Roseovarius albus TaxID=1247867 RepID=A0A1X7A7U5_9RHOB|nr:ABC transporter permease subunit [Roseovarius albus]SLN71095.1 putative glutamine ABC transporter permease protein GlnM [Roseovarius albus]